VILEGFSESYLNSTLFYEVTPFSLIFTDVASIIRVLYNENRGRIFLLNISGSKNKPSKYPRKGAGIA
jgi:hypothetical protein